MLTVLLFSLFISEYLRSMKESAELSVESELVCQIWFITGNGYKNMTQILPAKPRSAMESLQTLQFLSCLVQTPDCSMVDCVGLSVFQYNSDDCIWLLVATVCSNESTLSLEPRAGRLQMIVGNLGRTSRPHWHSQSILNTQTQLARLSQCCHNRLLYLSIVIVQCFTVLDT